MSYKQSLARKNATHRDERLANKAYVAMSVRAGNAHENGSSADQIIERDRLTDDLRNEWLDAVERHNNAVKEFAVVNRDEYFALCDEMNDGAPGDLKLEDADPVVVRRAARYAAENDRSWPPRVGDYDRAYADGLTR